MNDYLVENLPSDMITTITVNEVPGSTNEHFLVTYYIVGSNPMRIRGAVFARASGTA